MACNVSEWISKYIKMQKHWLNEYLNIFGWPRIKQTNIRIYLDWCKATNTNMNDICGSFLKEYSCSSLLVYSDKICSVGSENNVKHKAHGSEKPYTGPDKLFMLWACRCS